ncbi:hypothetical protein HER32_12260 [Hymenobacter sp. BT18]|uniref:NACHT domain-containing protein n=1 Tax=Hymenobacter sp. BT18 TaxID=2835648 RepID=UPI00143E7A25|nr:hypothetical protein [Hymenobacter sp. BT18]QIX61914.1 hypothetical protein HER32_12260 [Hymenobacter sp. BT18]
MSGPTSRYVYPRILSYGNIFSGAKNVVVLGNPGAGKSVMCKSIICSILEDNKTDFEDKTIFDTLPFRIELRKYYQFKKDKKNGIIKYISFMLEHEYQIANIPDLKIKELFNTFKTLVFFDGLDEIFDVSEKIDIKNDIEIFCMTFDNARCVVTSRIIGYEEVKLKSSLFCDINIINFNNEQISQYVRQWYANEEVDEDLRKQDVEGFLSHKDEIDAELITNPLLLSLIVILYRNNLKIPESKLEIYQSCTKTLVDKWDGIKELNIALDDDISKRKESIFADLAFWHYEQAGSKNASITNIRVQEAIAEAIVNKLKITDDFIRAMEMAEKFLDYAQKRSLYFDNNFTHKTFLEYFTAFWIYSNVEKKHKVDERNRIIKKYIASNFWYVVLELLLNMIDDNQADNEMLDELIGVQMNSRDAYPFLLIVLPTLKNVSNKMANDVYVKSILLEIDTVNEDLSKSSDKLKLLRDASMRYNIYAYYEVRSGHNGIYEKFIQAYDEVYEIIKEDDKKMKTYFIMYAELYLNGMGSRNKAVGNYISNSKHKDKYIEYSEKEPYLNLINIYGKSFVDGNFKLEYMVNNIKAFGVENFFKPYDSLFARFRISLITMFTHVYFDERNNEDMKTYLWSWKKQG